MEMTKPTIVNLRNYHHMFCSQPKGAYVEELPEDITENPENWVMDVKENGERMTLQLNAHGDNIMVGRNRVAKKKGVAKARDFQQKFAPHDVPGEIIVCVYNHG